MTKQQVSHIIGSRPIKNIGHELAPPHRAGLRHPHRQPRPQRGGPTHAARRHRDPTLQEAADLPAYADGAGVKRVTVSRQWLLSNVAIPPDHAPSSLSSGMPWRRHCLTATRAIVDRSATRIDRDGIYVVARLAEIYILRIRRQLDGTLLFSSDNQAYPPPHHQQLGQGRGAGARPSPDDHEALPDLGQAAATQSRLCGGFLLALRQPIRYTVDQ